jgi:RNA polymerase sigma-70 factor (ECF subfamily)
VVQESFLKVLEGRARFNGTASIKTWLFSIIRNTAIDHRRKMMRPIPMPEINGAAETPEEGYHERLIKSLPARQSEVLILVFYHDQTLEQCADVMDISIGSVRTHYDRGKKKLKELIKQQTLKSHG